MAQEFGAPLTPETPKKKNTTLIIVLVVIAVVLLLCCCCGGVGYWLYNSGTFNSYYY